MNYTITSTLIPLSLALSSLCDAAFTRVNFTVGSEAAFIIEPATRAANNPWIMYAPTLGSDLPGSSEAFMIQQFADNGITVAGVNVGESYGTPRNIAGYDSLYNDMVNTRGFSDQLSMLTRSRGGLMGFSWAMNNPEKVTGIAGIYPITSLLGWSGATATANSYGSNLSDFNPIDNLTDMANEGVKLFLLHGDNDSVVPLTDNSQITHDRYLALGGDSTLSIIQGGGHDLSNHWFTDQPLTDFLIQTSLIPEPSSTLLISFAVLAFSTIRRRDQNQ